MLLPLTSSVTVWHIVTKDPPLYDLACQACNPPIFHSTETFLKVSNLTSNWISSMLVLVLKHIASSHLSVFQIATIPKPPHNHNGNSKCSWVQEVPLVSSHLAMHPIQVSSRGSKLSHQQQCHQGTAVGGEEVSWLFVPHLVSLT